MPLHKISSKVIADCAAGKIKYVLFDRDGTLTATSTEEGGYITKVGQITLIDGVHEALNKLTNMGVGLFVFTQQKCIGKGLVSEQVLMQIHQEVNAQLAPSGIQSFKYCPHIEADNCSCMKPYPQMLTELMTEHDMKAEEILVVGDSPRDFECAQNAGVGERFVFIADDLGRHQDYYAKVKAEGGLFFETVKAMVDDLFKG